MTNNLYELFGLDEGCTDEQLDEAYGRIRSKYAEDRFLEGEAGNEAARKLTEIDNAYRDIIALRRENAGGNSSSGDAFKTIEEKIKNGDLAGAQSDLDAFNGIISSRWFSTRKNGQTRAKNSSKSHCRWIPATKNTKRLTISLPKR